MRVLTMTELMRLTRSELCGLESAAGIGAARWLAARHVSTLLIEASDRVGGRARTENAAGLPLDLGCELRASRLPARIAQSSVDPEQRSQTFAHFGEHDVRCASGMLDRSFLPGDAAGLVGQYDAAETGTIRQHGLERIVARTAGDRADHAKSGCRIVVVR
jgi:hypothetical protein